MTTQTPHPSAVNVDCRCCQKNVEKKTLKIFVGATYATVGLAALCLCVLLTLDAVTAVVCHAFVVVVVSLHWVTHVISTQVIDGYAPCPAVDMHCCATQHEGRWVVVTAELLVAVFWLVSLVSLATPGDEESLRTLALTSLVVLTLAQVPCLLRVFRVVDMLETAFISAP